MAYENIRFVKPNMEFVDGYFYTMDESSDMLVQKVDDGSTAYSYPLDVLIGGTVSSLQYDGANFWTLQDSGNGFVIKRWRIENHIAKLKDSFTYTDTAEINYDADTFAVENYRTEFDCTVSGGDLIVCPDEYYDSVITSGTVLTLGPNRYDQREEVTVSGVIGSDVILVSGTQYTYESGDSISMYRSFFVFNNYTGLSSAKGNLMRFNAYTGDLIASDSRTDYKDITACTFARVQNLLRDYDDAHTVIFVKSTSARFRNISDLVDILRADSVNDNFNGPNGSSPNTTRWSTTYGNPIIYNNQLFCSTVINGKDEIVSNYELIGDFSAQISGSLDGYTTFSGAEFEHYMRFIFSNDEYCTISRVYNSLFGDAIIADYYGFTQSDIDLTEPGGTIAARNYWSSDYPSKAIDNNTSTYYQSNGTSWPKWLAYDFEVPTIINKVRIYFYPNHFSSTVYVQGSNDLNPDWDSKAWNVVYTMTGLSSGSWQEREFSNTDVYRFYRLWGNSGGPGSNGWWCIYEIEMMGSRYIGVAVTSSGVSFDEYRFKINRTDSDLSFYYKALTSGILDTTWNDLGSMSLYEYDGSMCLGLHSASVTVSGAYFDDLIYNSGHVRYPPVDIPYYDVMVMDNIRSNQSTIIPITDISYYNGNLYRLQDEGTYYGVDNDWGSQYNYVCSPVRSFIDSITVDAYPIILPANARNISTITCIVLDQYSNGAINKPINFTDTDDYGYITINPQNTDALEGTGEAVTYYVAGVDVHTVTIQGTVTQYD